MYRKFYFGLLYYTVCDDAILEEKN
nr:hypothetical protein [Bacillus clarus]